MEPLWRMEPLGRLEPLGRMERVSVVGNSGSGKSTLARALAAAMGVPHLELDSVYHQPGWEPLPEDEFRARVTAVVDGPGWVVDGNYSAVRELVWQRADTVVWLDPPRRTVMRQVIWRTLRRAALREELWNGNRERWRGMFARDPEESIILWAWQRNAVYHTRYQAASQDPTWQHLRFVPVRSRAEARRLVEVTRP